MMMICLGDGENWRSCKKKIGDGEKKVNKATLTGCVLNDEFNGDILFFSCRVSIMRVTLLKKIIRYLT